MNSAQLYVEARQHRDNAKYHYLLVVSSVVCELLTKGESPLISKFCVENDLELECRNYTIERETQFMQRATPRSIVMKAEPPCNLWDMITILNGVGASISEDLNSCLGIFDQCQEYIFREFPASGGELPRLIKILQSIDEVLAEQSSDRTTSKSSRPPSIKLNEIADARRAEDATLIENINGLQRTLQESLKQISDVRDAIDFNAMREPINQLIQLSSFVRELLEYHPTDAPDGYKNLVDACGDMLGYIDQSLAMLGVDVINEVEVPFEPSRHRAFGGGTPSRQSLVKRVIRPGFAYKGKTISKADVEIDGGRS